MNDVTFVHWSMAEIPLEQGFFAKKWHSQNFLGAKSEKILTLEKINEQFVKFVRFHKPEISALNFLAPEFSESTQNFLG